MGLTTKFLVDSTNYKQILETIRTDQYIPKRINKDYFEELGYTNPTDFLVLSLLMDLQLLDEDGSPTKLFEKFQNKETSKQALASGIIVAYEDLLDTNSTIYNASNDEIIELIEEKTESVKSEIILNYMANTFKALVNYAGQENIKNAWEEREVEKTAVETVAEEASKSSSKNGTADDNDIKATETLVAEATERPKNGTKSHHIQDDITEDETPEEDNKMQEENEEIEKKERDTEETTSNSGNKKERNTDNKEANNDNSEYKDRYVENGIAKDETDSSEEENATQENPLLSSLADKMNQDISRVDKAFIKKATLLQKLERHDDAFFALDDVYIGMLIQTILPSLHTPQLP
ncbi:MAG: DUF5343 domain-containing protein [Balneolaceae bacterium]|nr:DUF5343 domain-containing protein [Balneolaceae bacterium]